MSTAVRHEITRVALDQWLADERFLWRTFASSSGLGSDKRLIVRDEGRDFRVTDHGKILYEGFDKAAAIEAYNSAR